MACACSKRRKTKYQWTSADGTETQVYATEMEAKAKVIRKGGSYVPLTGG